MTVSPHRSALVEGDDDAHVLAHVCSAHGISTRSDFDIATAGSVEQLIGSLAVRIKALRAEDFLAVIVDADADLGARWASMSRVLAAAGFTGVPTTPSKAGTVLRQVRLPTVGVWLMPDNQAHGILEHFAASLVDATDALWPVATDCVDRVAVVDQRFPSVAKAKAIIHTWLAWQERPGTRLGAAVNQRYLNPTTPAAVALVSWLTSSLGLPSPPSLGTPGLNAADPPRASAGSIAPSKLSIRGFLSRPGGILPPTIQPPGVVSCLGRRSPSSAPG